MKKIGSKSSSGFSKCTRGYTWSEEEKEMDDGSIEVRMSIWQLCGQTGRQSCFFVG